MLDQQIESVSNKLIQFIQDLTLNLQKINTNKNSRELFQLCSDYAKQLASLFEILITKLIEEYFPNRTIQIQINLDPVHTWRLIQNSIDQLNNLQSQDLDLIIKHIRNINKYFYNLLLQIKNSEFFKIDQTRTINENLIEELNSLSKSLINFTTNCCNNNNTYLFQNLSTTNTNNNHLNEKSNNSNCCPQQQCNGLNFPFNSRSVPIVNAKPMDTPLCFPAPVVYTPEMETLFSSGGIIYARKSGNTWVAENLGTLVETLKDIGQTIDMNEHCEILVRKTGELLVRRKKGRRKRFLQQQTFNKTEQSDSDTSNNNNNDQ